jgi:hypothetical protein
VIDLREKKVIVWCRFDVRAVLDYIPPYNPKLAHPMSAEDQELEAELNYSRYKDIIEITRTGGILEHSDYCATLLTCSVAQEESVIKEVYNKIEDAIVDVASFKGGPPPPQEE